MKFTTQVEEPVQIRPLWLSWLGMWCEATGLLPKQHIAVSVAGKLSLDDMTERLARDGQKFLTSTLFLHRLVKAPGKRAFRVKLGRESSLAQPLSQCRIFLCIFLDILYILWDFFWISIFVLEVAYHTAHTRLENHTTVIPKGQMNWRGIRPSNFVSSVGSINNAWCVTAQTTPPSTEPFSLVSSWLLTAELNSESRVRC